MVYSIYHDIYIYIYMYIYDILCTIYYILYSTIYYTLYSTGERPLREGRPHRLPPGVPHAEKDRWHSIVYSM